MANTVTGSLVFELNSSVAGTNISENFSPCIPASASNTVYNHDLLTALLPAPLLLILGASSNKDFVMANSVPAVPEKNDVQVLGLLFELITNASSYKAKIGRAAGR